MHSLKKRQRDPETIISEKLKMIFNFLKKQESKEEIDTSAARDSVESLLDPDSFEYKYLKPFLKSDNLYYDDIEFYKDKPEFICEENRKRTK